MKRNGMCPICYLKQILMHPSQLTKIDVEEDYENGVAKTPPMGWSSWNTFKNNIDENLILDTAKAMKEKGLIDAGYKFLNLDDCWHANQRDENGELQGDLVKFSSGIAPLVKKLNALGLKVGAYSSNGTYTCEDLPASLGCEEKDALTIARWGIEFFKYDFCHNVAVPSYAPLIYAIDISECGTGKVLQRILADKAIVSGNAKKMSSGKIEGGKYISGMDNASGLAVFNVENIPSDGNYILTINVFKKGLYDKFLRARVNKKDYFFDIPPQKTWNVTARFSQIVSLKAGTNVIELTNPIGSRADSSMLQYYRMGQALKKATATVAKENKSQEKPIVYSVCEWGKNQPYLWASKAGNMWRTTPDIIPQWYWIKHIYHKNVELYKYASVGHYNDPDMLEVGNGKLNVEQNKTHFALWCMMAAPLMLGNDIRNIKQEVIDIVTNKGMLAIDQDPLCKQAKRIIKSNVDVLARPLQEGYAVGIFNLNGGKKTAKIDWDKIKNDDYIKANWSKDSKIVEVWSQKEYSIQELQNIELKPYESKVYIIK